MVTLAPPAEIAALYVPIVTATPLVMVTAPSPRASIPRLWPPVVYTVPLVMSISPPMARMAVE